MASPTSTGSGSRLTRPPFPATTTSPHRQATSSNRSPATSPDRSPRRAISISSARSRRPATVKVSHEQTRAATVTAEAGSGSPAARTARLGGTALASPRSITPVRNRNRRNARTVHTRCCTVLGAHPRPRSSTNPRTSPALSEPTGRPSSRPRSWPATTKHCWTDRGLRARSSTR